MDAGQEWVYRPKARTPGAPVFRARIEKVRPGKSPKVQIRVLDGEDAGLLTWVSKITLQVPWAQHDAWSADEERYELAVARSASWFDTPEFHAAMRLADEIWTGVGIQVGYNVPVRGLLLVADAPAAKAAFGQDLEELLADELSFTDRFGTLVAPKDAALRWAQRAAGIRSDEVLRLVQKEEAQLRDSLVHGKTSRQRRGEEYWFPPELCAEWFEDDNAVLQVLRSWCGAKPQERFDELVALREEVERLNAIVQRALSALRAAGLEQAAEDLHRAFGYRPGERERPEHR